MVKKLVLLRHGQSEFNKSGQFTGWTDVDLTLEGEVSARHAGELLKAHGFVFDQAHTSFLRRAIRTLLLALEEMEQLYIPVHRTWRLNEKSYGALQGLHKKAMAEEVGEEQVKLWRRSFAVAPPALEENDERHPKFDPRYSMLSPSELPATESLKDCIARVVPYWKSSILPAISAGKVVLVAAHGNSLRALVKHIDNISDDDILNLNIPTATPLVYEFSDDMKPLRHYYLGNQKDINAAINAVANEGSKK